MQPGPASMDRGKQKAITGFTCSGGNEMSYKNRGALVSAAVLAALIASTSIAARAQAVTSTASQISIGVAGIGGVVTSAQGPEAGVWVIAETTDLPTKFAKIVVTDDAGRFVIPDLPKANYKVWVRGYGLVDSPRVDGAPGQTLNLAATIAPTAAAAAKYYPGMYWYSMLQIPAADQFPGTGEKGNGIPPFLKARGAWIDTVKNSCQSCHALGSENIRSPHVKELGNFENSTEMWMRRLQSGQAMTNMAVAMMRLGPEKGLSLYADWTDRIANGELPESKPPRPTGLERNMVVSLWDWAEPTTYMHDAISTDKRHPSVNANGYIYGSPEESTDNVPVLDPVQNKTWFIKHPYADPKTPSLADEPMGESVFWGDKPIWDGHTSNHNLIFDEDGRLWFAARIRSADDPAYCKAGSGLPSAKVVPLTSSVRHLSLYEPKTEKFTLIDTCFTTQHLYFGHDANNTLWTSAGGAGAPVVGWLNTKMFLETRDAKMSQGWSPLIVDVPGWGKRGAYAEADQPVDPARQKRVIAGFYGVQASPVDDTIWGQSMDIGFSRMDQPGYLIHFIPGSDPANTSMAELFQPPEGTFGPRGIDIDTKGVVWTALSSGQLASFDRSKCSQALKGPNTVTGKQCAEGWSLYRFPGPQFKGVDASGSADHAYYVWVDRYNTFGLGEDVPLAMTNGSESINALVNGKFVTFHVPYPAGFFTKNVDGRIDDPNTGWKGRGLWTTSGTRTMFHNETGKGERPRVFHIQLRPDPLAH
jgi:hypothetical protein